MDYLTVIITSLGSLIALFFLTKLVGAKQISELTMFDYIVSISIGSIAAEMATELEKPLKPLIAMIVYSVVSFLMSYVTVKSLKLRRFIVGKSVILMYNGKLFKNNLKKTHIEIDEFLMQCRTNGYFDVSAINTAILETSGKISFLPFPDKRPVTPEDLKVIPASDTVFYNVILEGKILDKNLQCVGKDRNWIKNELKVQGIKNENDIFLATLDVNGTLNVFKNENFDGKNDIFQ